MNSMPRCNGYRPKAEVRDEVTELRARLAELTDDKWAQASSIMHKITLLLGHTGGPMGGKIEPRVCKYCKHYGHTRQWCKVRIAREQEQYDRECDALLAEEAKNGVLTYSPPTTEWATWCKLADWAYTELVKQEKTWTDEEWAVEFRKRAGHFDHENQQILVDNAELAAQQLVHIRGIA